MYGYIRVVAAAPEVHVAAPAKNAGHIIRLIDDAERAGATLLVLPELAVTGYTCGDLFFQSDLIAAADDALGAIAAHTAAGKTLIVLGTPVSADGRLYDAAVVLQGGRVLGVVPKTKLSAGERRHFASPNGAVTVRIAGQETPMSAHMTFGADNAPGLTIGVALDDRAAEQAARAGATVIARPYARPELVGRAAERRTCAAAQSGRLYAAYVCAGSGSDESTTDCVFGGHCLIAAAGAVRAESVPFGAGRATADVDAEALVYDRRKEGFETDERYERVPFTAADEVQTLLTPPERLPFVPADSRRAAEILDIQAFGLKKRLERTGARAVLGVSGGLDSTLALLVIRRAYELMRRPMSDCLAVTMPCFGTSDRTLNNARALIRAAGAQEKVVDITQAVRQHFLDIGHDESVLNAAYENAQARERTQVLMDLANDVNGLVVGTGDLSEAALGWATFNGDHMSMYNVNASVPKTLVRYLVAETARADETLRPTLTDILGTEISPELLPAADGRIAQRTEDIVGKYEYNDFFLYHIVRYGAGRDKVLWLAGQAFPEATELSERLDAFYRRFTAQQFKRSVAADGVQTGAVTLSPRGGWVMGSDTEYEPRTRYQPR